MKLSPTAEVFLVLTALLVVVICIAVPIGITYSASNSAVNVSEAANFTGNDNDNVTDDRCDSSQSLQGGRPTKTYVWLLVNRTSLESTSKSR